MYTKNYLFDFTKSVFIKMGCSMADSEIIADVFLAAELRRHSSHPQPLPQEGGAISLTL